MGQSVPRDVEAHANVRGSLFLNLRVSANKQTSEATSTLVGNLGAPIQYSFPTFEVQDNADHTDYGQEDTDDLEELEALPS